MTDRIYGFQGEYRWLSNFWEHPIECAGLTWRCGEGLYQAGKSQNPDEQLRFVNLSGRQAKHQGRRIYVQPHWWRLKLDHMKLVIDHKFNDEQMAVLLLATGDQEIIEANTWNDTFWGVRAHDGFGQNHLGKIIMNKRKELRDGK